MSFCSPLEAENFRLLHLVPSQDPDKVECTLRPHPLQDAPRFTALSYTWTDPQPLSLEAIPIVVINNVAVQVGSNLASALLQLRRSGHVIVWADAVCINQDDLQERSSQVSLMGRIYQQASNVFVWLGRAILGPDLEHDLTNVAFGFLDEITMLESLFLMDNGRMSPRLARYCFEMQLSPRYSVVIAALRALLGLDYWQRAWILQEISLNNNVDIAWGERSLNWRNFKNVFIYLSVNSQFYSIQSLILDIGYADGSSNVAFERIRVLETLSGYRSNLQYALAIARTTKQTDPRDALYAKIGLSYDGNKIVSSPDYSVSAEEVYCSFARSFIKTQRSLYIICMSYPELIKRKLPSWVPDWSHPAPRKQFYQEIRPDSYKLVFKATGESEPAISFGMDGMTVSVAGFQFDVIPETKPTGIGMEPLPDAKSISNIVESFIRASIACHYVQDDTYDAFDLMEGMVERIAETAASLVRDPSHLSKTYPSKHQQAVRRFESWFESVRDLQLGQATLAQWLVLYTTSRQITPQYRFETFRPDPLIDLFGHFLISAKIMGAGRRIVVLPNGSAASIPVESVPGDRVCLLLGCPVPVILRAVGESYTVVGECYVDGIMHGETMSGLLEGLYEQSTFCIR